MAHVDELLERVKHSIVGARALPQLDDRLTSKPQVFRAPPLTRELAATIKRIAPHFNLSLDERCRAFWQADQNGTNWGEYEALASVLDAMPTPTRVLEIGPGLGRSIVFFNKSLGWTECEFHAYEGEGRRPRYTLLAPRTEDSFCGDLRLLRQVLDHNDVQNVTIYDAHRTRLDELPGPYDFIYSFYGVGFHWSLEHFLDDILALLAPSGIAVFTVPQDLEPFPALASLTYRIVDWHTAWPKGGTLSLLVLSKRPLPDENDVFSMR